MAVMISGPYHSRTLASGIRPVPSSGCEIPPNARAWGAPHLEGGRNGQCANIHPRPRRRDSGSDLKLEIVAVPVRNVDRAKDFYLQLGCRLDADFVADPDGTGWLLQEIKTRLPGR